MSDDRHDRVSRRAYELWEQQGGEHGRHEDHWRRASAEIDAPVGEQAPDDTTPTATREADEAKPARKRATSKPAAAPVDQASADKAPVDRAPAKPRKPRAK